MIEQDTIKLLRECDAGIKMGVQSIEDSLKYTSNGELKRTLEKNLAGHIEIQERLQGLLNSYHDSGKEPPAMAKGMAQDQLQACRREQRRRCGRFYHRRLQHGCKVTVRLSQQLSGS